MKRRHVLKAAAAVIATGAVIAVPSAVAAAAAPKVSVRIEGLNKTLMTAKTVQTRTGNASRSGHSFGRTTALGALNTAVNGDWKGSWSSEYKEWELIGIKGENHAFTSKDFWAVYVNHVEASKGVSEIKLKPGEQIVFAALPDTRSEQDLLGLKITGTRRAGKTLSVKVVAYDAKGKRVALKDATLKYNGKTVKKDQSSYKIKPTKAGKLKLTVSKSGYVRTQATITVRKA